MNNDYWPWNILVCAQSCEHHCTHHTDVAKNKIIWFRRHQDRKKNSTLYWELSLLKMETVFLYIRETKLRSFASGNDTVMGRRGVRQCLCHEQDRCHPSRTVPGLKLVDQGKTMFIQKVPSSSTKAYCDWNKCGANAFCSWDTVWVSGGGVGIRQIIHVLE